MQHQDIKAKRNNLPTPPLRILFLWICPWKWQVEFYVWYILTLCLESNYLVNKKNYVFWKIRKMVNSCFTGVLSYCGFKVYNPRYCEVCFYLVNQPHYGSHIQTVIIVICRLWFWNLFDTISHTMRGPPVYLYYIPSCFYIKDIHI